jgi:hypothetical protein
MKKILPHVLAALAFAFPFIVFAQAFAPLAPVSGSSKLGGLYGANDITTFINTLFKFALGVGAIGAVLRLSYAGYLYMGQADMWSHKGQAKTIIGDVTLGLLLLLSIWLILYQINPDILSLNALQTLNNVPAVAGNSQSAATPEQVWDYQGPTTKPGEYCYSMSGGGFACDSDSATCSQSAQIVNATCSYTPPINLGGGTNYDGNLTQPLYNPLSNSVCGFETGQGYICGYASMTTCAADSNVSQCQQY